MLDLDVITIIDDDIQTAEAVQDLVLDLGLEVELITEGPYDDVEQLIQKITGGGGRRGVICDHRLQYYGLASFYGSQVLAALYDLNIPGVLLTQFSDADVDTTIRRYRRWLPTMIARDSVTMKTIANGLETCQNEMKGDLLVNRRPYRTLVEIVGHSREGSETVADAFVPGWNPQHAVRFPLSLMNAETQSHVISSLDKTKRAFAFANVNIGAKDSAELFFDNFIWAPEPASSPLDQFYRED